MKNIFRISFIILIVNLFFNLGCDIFSVRVAETPEDARANFIQATTPTILIENFTNSLKEKNTQNYLSTLSDSTFTKINFQFLPSAGASSRFPGLAQNWNLKSEEQYFNNIKNKMPSDQPMLITLSEVVQNSFGDSLFYSASYFLNIPHSDEANPKQFQGEIKLKFIRDSRSVWSIYYWQDLKNSDLPTWSELKGLYY